jgi:hypothetical protein
MTVDLASPALSSLQRVQPQYKHKTSLVKSILSPMVSLLPRIRSRSSKRQESSEGLIAPRTPVRGSPLHSPVPMQQSYFPWGEESPSSSNSKSNSNPNSIHKSSHNPSPEPSSSSRQSLGVTSAMGSSSRGSSISRMKTPPPPRRIASEANVLGVNPRGIATRNGVPFASDQVATAGSEVLQTHTPPSSISATGSSALDLDLGGESGRSGAGRSGHSSSSTNNPSMSLGPERGEPLGGAEVVVVKSKRKED